LIVSGRSSEKTTSSAVNSEPSWNFTPSRSLNSQVRSSTARHDTARPGFRRWFSSLSISRPKTCSPRLAFGVRRWKCGSIEVTSAARPIVIDCACAAAAARLARTR
jgi:hypothetical protein